MKDVYENIELDEEYQPLLLSMGQYKLFMAHGAAGRDAMAVFLHLMFTARLQQTNQVKANLKYIQKGTGKGERAVKAAKALLAKWGMIEYTRGRRDDGTLDEVYIRIRYMPTSEAVAKAEQAESTDGGESDPPATTGAVTARVDTHTCGSDGQMLEVNNEMLEVRNLNYDSQQADSSNRIEEERRSEESEPDSESVPASPSVVGQSRFDLRDLTRPTMLPELIKYIVDLEYEYGVLETRASDIDDAEEQFYIWNNFKKYGWAYIDAYENYLNGHHKPEHDDCALRYFHGILARGKFLEEKSA